MAAFCCGKKQKRALLSWQLQQGRKSFSVVGKLEEHASRFFKETNLLRRIGPLAKQQLHNGKMAANACQRQNAVLVVFGCSVHVGTCRDGECVQDDKVASNESPMYSV